VAKGIALSKKKTYKIDGKDLQKYLGVRSFASETEREKPMVGVATGVAWTMAGGEVMHVEATTIKGGGRLTLTGKLGDVMKESAHAALSYIRSRAKGFGIDENFLKTTDVHIHVPAGAIPKDGPSAGVTMATALVSALTGVPVRNDITMTGEITLRGRVLAIGGLKEKSLAAKRAGIDEIIIPEQNQKDLQEIPENIRKTIKFHVAKTADQVLNLALTKKLAAIRKAANGKEQEKKKAAKKSKAKRTATKKPVSRKKATAKKKSTAKVVKKAVAAKKSTAKKPARKKASKRK
jgi:ATP-dependent Lon protease